MLNASTAKPEATERFNGRHIEPIGGRYWRCTDCGKQIEAECECCEPPHCNCKQS